MILNPQFAIFLLATIRIKWTNDFCFFFEASEIGDLDVIRSFVEHGANLDYAPSGFEADELNITGQTALFMATLKEQEDVVKYLIEKGSKVNVKNRYGVSPLLLCAEGGNQNLVELLCSAGADVNMSPSGQLAMDNILAGQVGVLIC